MEDQSSDFRCGTVAIVGRPNVGKSTLLNLILGEKVTIVSKIPQTTRYRIRGIHNEERGQIIFIDTPGLVLGKDKLDRLLKKTSVGTMQETDCVIHLVDVHVPTGEAEEELVKKLNKIRVPVILGLNKVDKKKNYTPEYIALWERVSKKSIKDIPSFTMISLSSREGTNVDQLVDLLFEQLPEGPALYPTDSICDIPQKMAIADIIREKLLNTLREEIPHAVAVVIENIQPKRKKTIHIRAVVLVERESQKEIVIGKAGQLLKKVGTLARTELEELLESKVFLELYVKVQKNWRDNSNLLLELGYDI